MLATPLDAREWWRSVGNSDLTISSIALSISITALNMPRSVRQFPSATPRSGTGSPSPPALRLLENIADELHDLAAPEAGHVDVVPVQLALVVVPLAVDVHQVELVNQTVPLQQLQRSVPRAGEAQGGLRCEPRSSSSLLLKWGVGPGNIDRVE